MKFVKRNANPTPIVDSVFSVMKLAHQAIEQYGDDAVINGTIGSLCDEDGKLVALKTVFDNYDSISDTRKAAYASSFIGNPDYCTQVYNWVLGNQNYQGFHQVIATPGGSGAVSSTFHSLLDEGETVIIPFIAWGSYTIMAENQGLKFQAYQLFENDSFNLTSFKETCLDVLQKQNKLLVVINDPCHNPTGYSLTLEEWQEIILFLNECAEKAPVILLNDIAYIDYCYDPKNCRNYLSLFNQFSENVVAVIAFSTSKSLTSYGLRCGASIILGTGESHVQEVAIEVEKTARSTWSNIPNAAMDNFVQVTTTHLEEFIREKQYYVDLLQERSNIFLEENKQVGLPLYPYKEGFFITIRMEDNKIRNLYHEELLKHNLFFVKVNRGIRIAICSIPKKKVYGLARKMKDILVSISVD